MGQPTAKVTLSGTTGAPLEEGVGGDRGSTGGMTKMATTRRMTVISGHVEEEET